MTSDRKNCHVHQNLAIKASVWLPDTTRCGIICVMGYYYAIPTFLTLLFAFSYLLVHTLLAAFDRLNFFWDWWDRQRKAYPILIGAEIAYFGAILYYIVYWELSGNV